MFGIDSLMEKTLYILKKEYPFNEQYFKQLEEYKDILDEKIEHIDDSRRDEINEEVKLIYKELSLKNNFFASFGGVKEIKQTIEEYCKKSLVKYINSLSNSFGFPNVGDYYGIFITIANIYKILSNEIMLLPIKEKKKQINEFIIIEGEDIEDTLIKKEIEQFINKGQKADWLTWRIDPQEIKLNSESISIEKYNFLPNNIGSYLSFADKIKNYFDKYCQHVCYTNYILKRKEIFLNIFKQIEEMQKITKLENRAEIIE